MLQDASLIQYAIPTLAHGLLLGGRRASMSRASMGMTYGRKTTDCPVLEINHRSHHSTLRGIAAPDVRFDRPGCCNVTYASRGETQAARPWIRQAAQAVAARHLAVHGIVLSDVGRSRALGLRQLKITTAAAHDLFAARLTPPWMYSVCAVLCSCGGDRRETR